MQQSKRPLWAFSLALALTITTPSFAGDRGSSIDPAYPVGSATYLFTLSAGQNGQSLTYGELHQTTVKVVNQALKLLEKQEAGKKSRPIHVMQFTVTYWNDGTTEAGPLSEATVNSLDKMLDRLESKTERRPAGTHESLTTPTTPPTIRPASLPVKAETHPTAARPQDARTPPQQPPAGTFTITKKGQQCERMTAKNQRCTRAARDQTHFCWQHSPKPAAATPSIQLASLQTKS